MSLFNLNSVPEEEREHFIFCPDCRIYIDCRDLGEVFGHMHDPKLQNPSAKEITKNYTSSSRVGEPNVEYLNDKGGPKFTTTELTEKNHNDLRFFPLALDVGRIILY